MNKKVLVIKSWDEFWNDLDSDDFTEPAFKKKYSPGNLLAEFKKDKYTPAFDGKTLQFSFDVEDIPSQMLVTRSNLHILILACADEGSASTDKGSEVKK